MSIALRIAYDGTDFHGFARDPRLRTVQGELEAALSRLYKTAVLVRGASRTDAGVHALGQVVAFDPPFTIPLEGLLRALAAELASDVAASAAWEQAGIDGGRLEPRFQNDGKHYRYRIRSGPARNPLDARYEWHTRRRLDVGAMREAAAHLVGTHDFAGFRAAACQAVTTVRRITRVDVHDHPPTREPPREPGVLEPEARIVEIDVEGDAFLRNMVRIMAGTLVEVGLGKRPAASMPDLLRRGDRSEAGATAPAHGLLLVEVKWTR